MAVDGEQARTDREETLLEIIFSSLQYWYSRTE